MHSLGYTDPHTPARASTKFPLCELASLEVSWAGWLESGEGGGAQATLKLVTIPSSKVLGSLGPTHSQSALEGWNLGGQGQNMSTCSKENEIQAAYSSFPTVGLHPLQVPRARPEHGMLALWRVWACWDSVLCQKA